MKIAVTGGSGFIGTNLVKHLSKKHEVRILDKKIPLIKNIQFIKGSVIDPKNVQNIVKDTEYVIHLAAILGVKKTEDNPLKTLKINIEGTKNVLEACRKFDVKKIIFSSSSEVYGEPQKIPISEDDQLYPKSCYGISKLVCEEYIKAYHKTYGLSFTILRYFNVYGPEQRTEFVIPQFVKLALSNKSLTIYGNGNQIRAFTYVDDAIRGTILTLEKGDNEIFNIGNDREPIKIKELAKKILTLTKSKSKLVFIPMEKSDRIESREIHHRIPKINKAKSILGYVPIVSLNEGILNVIKNFKGIKNENIS